MPVAYRIEPELGIIYYLCIGQTSSTEILKAEAKTSRDPLRQRDMKIILDFSYGSIDVLPSSLRDVVKLNQDRMASGLQPEMTALITPSRFGAIFADTLELAAKGIPLKFRVYTTLPDAIRWLGLDEHAERILALQQTLRQTNPQQKTS